MIRSFGKSGPKKPTLTSRRNSTPKTRGSFTSRVVAHKREDTVVRMICSKRASTARATPTRTIRTKRKTAKVNVVNVPSEIKELTATAMKTMATITETMMTIRMFGRVMNAIKLKRICLSTAGRDGLKYSDIASSLQRKSAAFNPNKMWRTYRELSSHTRLKTIRAMRLLNSSYSN